MRKKPKKEAYKALIEKIEELPMDQRLAEHLDWIKRYRNGIAKSKREEIKRRMLKIADDIRFWAVQIAIENNDMQALLNLTKEIYDRYEDKPKTAGESAIEDDDYAGVVILPAINKIKVVKKRKDGSKRDET